MNELYNDKERQQTVERAEQQEKDTDSRIQIARDYYVQISRKLNSVMKRKGLKMSDIQKNCCKNKYPISQSAVSKILSYSPDEEKEYYSITLINFVQICKAMEVDPAYILNMDADIELHETVEERGLHRQKRAPLVVKMEEDEFQGYKGSYHCYFFPTISSEDQLLHGELSFSKSPMGDYCEARFSLDTNKYYESDKNKPIKKEYEGELIMSVRMGACYCLLHNMNIGEICFMVFHHMYLNNESLKCRLAMAATVSAGDNRRPTIHRILISRNPIPDAQLQMLKSQLLLNTSDIMISSTNFEKLKAREEGLPQEVEKLFDSAVHKEEYYKLSEFQIRNLDIPLIDKLRSICLLRNSSIAPKYNKVGSKSDELVFEYLSSMEQEHTESEEKTDSDK